MGGGREPDCQARSEHFAPVDALLGAEAAAIVLEPVHAFTPGKVLRTQSGNRTFMAWR